jgi:CheY-like chemotaxis protein
MEGTAAWEEDTRVPRFFDLISSELSAVDDAIASQLTVEHLCPRIGTRPIDTISREQHRLLVVDDHDGNRLTLAALLEDEGFAVDVAATFEEAEVRIREAASYAAAILDVNLGNRSGLDLVGVVHGRFPRAKIMIVTGDAAALRGSVGGVDAVVGKESDFTQWKTRLFALLEDS